MTHLVDSVSAQRGSLEELARLPLLRGLPSELIRHVALGAYGRSYARNECVLWFEEGASLSLVVSAGSLWGYRQSLVGKVAPILRIAAPGVVSALDTDTALDALCDGTFVWKIDRGKLHTVVGGAVTGPAGWAVDLAAELGSLFFAGLAWKGIC